MELKNNLTFFNASQKETFFKTFPHHDRFKTFFNTAQGLGQYERSIHTDVADMSYDDLEKACQGVKIYLPEHLSRFKTVLAAYIEWQASQGNENAKELATVLFRIRYNADQHLQEYLIRDPRDIINALEKRYPSHQAYYEPVVAILCWAGLDYGMICSLPVDALTEIDGTLKIQLDSYVLEIKDPEQVRIINAYLRIKDGSIVDRGNYSPAVMVTDRLLRIVPSARGVEITSISVDLMRRKMSAAFHVCCASYPGGIIGLQKSGYCNRLYLAEKDGVTDLIQYIKSNEPSAPESERKIKNLIDMYYSYKKVYNL